MADLADMPVFERQGDEAIDAPRTILVAQGDSAIVWRQALAASGCRLVATVAPAAAIRTLDHMMAPDLVCVAAADDPVSDPLLARLQHMSAQNDCAVAIEADNDALDHWFAALDGPHVAFLADARQLDRCFAIRSLIGEQRLSVREQTAGPDPVRLQQLSDEVQRMARTLAALTAAAADDKEGTYSGLQVVEQPRRAFSAPGDRSPRCSLTAATLRGIIRRRRLRDQFFTGEIFADPAWDMLLDLMAARLDGKEVSVSSLCIAAAVPATTALRWIRSMTDAGLFVRMADPYDGRRVYITLSEGAAAAMIAYFGTFDITDGPI